MRAFACGVCGAGLYFENSICMRCSTPAGFHRSTARLVPLEGEGRYVDRDGWVWQPCANREVCGCNWLAPTPVEVIPVDGADLAATLCSSCRLTRTRPADTDRPGMAAFATAEFAKRRLVYTLDRLALPVEPRADATGGLAFDLLSSARSPVVTGHRGGVITVDLAESDVVHREGVRIRMAEPYRTVLGHFRHEIGHYYWSRLVARGPSLDGFRALFGDERAGYDEALERHYRDGPPSEWEQDFVSRYATMHPWEDFAEVFAHVLHITDALQTSVAYGVDGGRRVADGEPFDHAVARVWLPLARGLNQINRGLGKDDLYPFVLAPTVIAKLRWVADLVRWTDRIPDAAR